MNPVTIKFIKNKLIEYLNLLCNNKIINPSSIVIDVNWKFFIGDSFISFHSNDKYLFSIVKKSSVLFTIDWCCNYTDNDVFLLKELLNINIYYVKPFYYYNNEILQLNKLYYIQRSLINLKELKL